MQPVPTGERVRQASFGFVISRAEGGIKCGGAPGDVHGSSCASRIVSSSDEQGDGNLGCVLHELFDAQHSADHERDQPVTAAPKANGHTLGIGVCCETPGPDRGAGPVDQRLKPRRSTLRVEELRRGVEHGTVQRRVSDGMLGVRNAQGGESSHRVAMLRHHGETLA